MGRFPWAGLAWWGGCGTEHSLAPRAGGDQAVGAAEGPGEGTTLQPTGAHSVGLLWWEPSRQPGGCSRLGALPDPRDVQSSGRENSVEKAKVALDLVLIICF